MFRGELIFSPQEKILLRTARLEQIDLHLIGLGPAQHGSGKVAMNGIQPDVSEVVEASDECQSEHAEQSDQADLAADRHATQPTSHPHSFF